MRGGAKGERDGGERGRKEESETDRRSARRREGADHVVKLCLQAVPSGGHVAMF